MVMTLLTTIAGGIAVIALAIVLARWAFALPQTVHRTNHTALPPSTDGTLAQAIARRSPGHEGKTGIHALPNGEDAFAVRMLLVEEAVSSIDAQYYIWRGDMTGYLLLDALLRAAQRGVQVRLLLDDNGISGLDAALATLDAHPNAEVRLYNPFNLRRAKMLSYTFDFFRLNRRMHNKSFTVDGHVTVMGGRNIGDEYFGAGTSLLFFDLDVLAVGEIVPRVSADFDRYWAAPPVHPAGLILRARGGPDGVAAGLRRFQDNPNLADYTNTLPKSDVVAALKQGRLDLDWSDALLISDDPIKGQGAVPRQDLLATRLLQAVGKIESRFDGVTPYFVPGAAGARAFATLAKRGVRVRMLTNALESNDVLPVHAGYAKRRGTMLKAGVELFELRKQSAPTTPRKKMRPFGSSGSSLHAKTFAVDGARVFVGSFNFDPRSTTLNTEMGLLIDSPRMAQAMHDAFDHGLSDVAWRVERRGLGLIWIDDDAQTETPHEPGATLAKRAALAIVARLPVEWLL
ncbi:phospholipase D family protein [Rhodobacteraceae bacterium KMM 6894]|nr:phospholipase D family protein [Rhodobacteraceae bacterium KMM 6894]